MVKKAKAGDGLPFATNEWNPDSKEPWLMEFEKKAVNDEKWSCIVTAAIQAEVQDEEYIQIFYDQASKGLRKSIKTITMSDVIQVLKGVEDVVQDRKKDSKKPGKPVPAERKSVAPTSKKNIEVLHLVVKYATLTETECKLPPDLMAVILKYMILNIKEENFSQKIMETMKARRMREEKIKSEFIRSLKSYEQSNTEEKKDFANGLEVVDDAPLAGPDLYIILINFYDPLYFAHLLHVKVPFVAIFRVTKSETSFASPSATMKTEMFTKKGSLVSNFWDQISSANIPHLKKIAIIQYEGPIFKSIGDKQKPEELVFDELSWLLYIAYSIYSEHQTYLQELHIQNLVLSLEPLKLSECHVYNKLCDALVTGEPNTTFLILYAMIEQVVAGIPDTESVPLTWDMNFSDLFPINSDLDLGLISSQENNRKSHTWVTPCHLCRNKKQPVNICQTLEESSNSSTKTSDWSESVDGSTIRKSIVYGEESRGTFHSKFSKSYRDSFTEEQFSEDLITKVQDEKKTEIEIHKQKKWKAPKLFFYGDYVNLEAYHCDPRILNPATVFNRFLKNSVLPLLWVKYPKLPPEDKAFFSYHFYNFLKISNQSEELLKLKIFFVLSMKLIGISNAYIYRGEEETPSEIFAERMKKLSKVKFQSYDKAAVQMKEKNFYFIKRLITESYFGKPRKNFLNLDNFERTKGSLEPAGSYLLDKVISQFNIHIHRDGGFANNRHSKHVEGSSGSYSFTNHEKNKEFMTFAHILDCLDISNLTDFHLIGNKKGFHNLIDDFNFYENLEADRMIQRLLEAKNSYNTTQCSYFPPTDTIMIIMYNDFDHRGMFFNCFYSFLATPVSLRDFFEYVYPDIGDWLIKNAKKTVQLELELKKKIKTIEDKADEDYLFNLKKNFCQMSEDEKTIFLETGSTTLLQDTDLENYIAKRNFQVLPLRFKPKVPNRISFVATNLEDVRVEIRSEVHQYHSKDGTEVSVTQDSWLYQPLALLTLCVKRPPLSFYYNQYLGTEEINTSFVFRTDSDIIFSFYKDDQDLIDTSQTEASSDFNYYVKISWPTGLIIQGKTTEGQEMYVKQSYMRVYRRCWEISEEKCRCFLKNGQILIFKENGDVEILCGSGTKYYCSESIKSESLGSNKKETSPKENKKTFSSNSIQRYEITTPLGETWEGVTKGPCKNKKRLINSFKVYIGIDSQTQEIFYKREDGVYCMLWPNGKLVTNFPDGTKITCVPTWDDEEITTEWTEEEKRHYYEMDAKRREELADQQLKSRTILRKLNGTSSQTSKLTSEQKSLHSFQIEGFVSVSCCYLMEHPKYASVSFDYQNPLAEIKMPKGLSIQMYPEGNYQVRQGNKVLKVRGTIVQFYSECSKCNERSESTVYLDPGEVLYKFVDFLKNVFIVQRNGNTKLQEYQLWDSESLKEDSESAETTTKCEHVENVASKQRCFAFQRDLSGIEFLNLDSLLSYCSSLPPDTHFDLHSTSPGNSITAHTFSSSYYKIGYEKWVMKYEDNTDSLPTNLKKKDLKELGVKDNPNKLFVYSFPKSKSFSKSNDKQDTLTFKAEMPKVIVTRIVKCLAEEPQDIINELRDFIATYQKRAIDICNEYKPHKNVSTISKDEKNVQMKLLKIALTSNQTSHAYPYLCDIVPSTEKDIHKAGHYIDLMETLKIRDLANYKSWPHCKQIQRLLSISGKFNSILEGNEFSH